MSSSTPLQRAERISHLFIAVIQKLVTEQALVADDAENITTAQLQALRFLSGCEHPLMGEVAHGLRISLPAATKAVDRLVRKDLVIREEDPNDRRVVRIRLTPKGRSIVQSITGRQMARLEKILDTMTQGDRALFVQGMEGFVRSAIADESVVSEICLNCGEDHTDDCPIKDEVVRMRSARCEPAEAGTRAV